MIKIVRRFFSKLHKLKLILKNLLIMNLLRPCLIFILSLTATSALGQNSIIEKLGYPNDAKLLIIHADDLGVSHSENLASILAIKAGSVNSASLMMPCPWVPEIANYAKTNQKADLGLHLTLTSEWKTMKWGPVASKNLVGSLLNPQGFFYNNCTDFEKNAKLEEVEIELRAQIEKAYNLGIKPTHLDTHMGCMRYNIDLIKLYLKLGDEYKIPVLIDKTTLASLPEDVKTAYLKKRVAMDKIITAMPDDFKEGMEKFYTKMLRELAPGLNIFLIHTAFNDAEMQALTLDHPQWGAAWRQEDFNFFTSDLCKELLQKENIVLISWRQIQESVYKN